MKGIDVSIQAITNKGVRSGGEPFVIERASKTLRKCFGGNVEGRNPDPTKKKGIK